MSEDNYDNYLKMFDSKPVAAVEPTPELPKPERKSMAYQEFKNHLNSTVNESTALAIHEELQHLRASANQGKKDYYNFDTKYQQKFIELERRLEVMELAFKNFNTILNEWRPIVEQVRRDIISKNRLN